MMLVCYVILFCLLYAANTLPEDQSAPLYEEDVSATDAARIEQALEIERYIAQVREDSVQLQGVFVPDFSSVEAYERSARKLRRLFEDSLGISPPGTPDNELSSFRKVGEDSTAVYYRSRSTVLPGVRVTGLFIVPRNRDGRAPLVIAQHGGGGSPELATFHGGANYNDMVRGAVAQGYVVWAPQLVFDMPGMPENMRRRLDIRARAIGTTLLGIEITKILRGLDVILRRPEVNRSRIAMIGLSYGGMYALYCTALDARIQVAVSSCGFGDRAKWLDDSEPDGWADIRYPNCLSMFRDPVVCGLICPRPLQIQMGINDDSLPVAEGRALAPHVADYYDRLNLRDHFEFTEFDGGHEFHGASAWDFLEKHL